MVSSPEYGIILARDMGIPARDGVHLTTGRWRPALGGEPLPGPLPAVMTRDDVITFETEPLDVDIEVTGPIGAMIYLSSDVPDTDLFVMVQDAYPASADWPHGFRLNVADGIMRARYREGFDIGRLLNPGQVVNVEFQIYPTSNRFVAGHTGVGILIVVSALRRQPQHRRTAPAPHSESARHEHDSPIRGAPIEHQPAMVPVVG